MKNLSYYFDNTSYPELKHNFLLDQTIFDFVYESVKFGPLVEKCLLEAAQRRMENRPLQAMDLMNLDDIPLISNNVRVITFDELSPQFSADPCESCAAKNKEREPASPEVISMADTIPSVDTGSPVEFLEANGWYVVEAAELNSVADFFSSAHNSDTRQQSFFSLGSALPEHPRSTMANRPDAKLGKDIEMVDMSKMKERKIGDVVEARVETLPADTVRLTEPVAKPSLWKFFVFILNHGATSSVTWCILIFLFVMLGIPIVINNVPQAEHTPTVYCTLVHENSSTFNITVHFVWVATDKPPPSLAVELNLKNAYMAAVGRIYFITNVTFAGTVEYPLRSLINILDFFSHFKNKRLPWTDEDIIIYCGFEENKQLYYTDENGRIAL